HVVAGLTRKGQVELECVISNCRDSRSDAIQIEPDAGAGNARFSGNGRCLKTSCSIGLIHYGGEGRRTTGSRERQREGLRERGGGDIPECRRNGERVLHAASERYIRRDADRVVVHEERDTDRLICSI